MTKYVYVVTMPELGWDCVVGIFDETFTLDQLEEDYPEDQYYIDQRTINSNDS